METRTFWTPNKSEGAGFSFWVDLRTRLVDRGDGALSSLL